jgi:AraC-like DNA-binding protein
MEGAIGGILFRMDFERVLLFVALLNGAVLVAALLSRKENHLANLFLSAAVATGLYFQFIVYLRSSGLIEQYPRLRRSGFPASLLDVPLLFLYVSALTSPDFRWSRRHLLHFLPFLFGLLWYLAFYAVPLDSPLWRNSEASLYERYARSVIGVSICGVYLGACFHRLRHYRRFVRQYFSELRRVRLRWLQWLLVLVTGPWLFELIDVLTGPYVTMDRYVVPLMTVVILLIGFFGLQQSVIFDADRASDSRHEIFSEEELTQWKGRLESFMEEGKPYLNPELRLVDLARGLGLRTYQVSELINRGAGTNFYDYVNRRRVDEAKRRLTNPAFSHMNILGIAVDSGFNSKSVFNDVFRRMTGKTPSEFRGQLA